ncbi:amino acid adenylation domain-containing protein [Azohydromonas lata]|uniref:Amino acid adenylation domain-containing protein n=1 Tax=Azohydromonas lata TaxID=45677 RepID=A0ABU5IH70_9BURK|nr:amino acid adenylation domain-containing protein [Azohydromonas lata]MDZ5458485.1 amino acid adenylation domain-containing protein [Azohydromonas lata]
MSPLLARLESVARAQPGRVALVADGRHLTFDELWTRAGDVADALRVRGVRPNDRVAVVGERGAEDFVHMLGIWRAGAAYVPIGTKVPPERAQRMLQLAGVVAVLAGRTDGLASRSLWVGSGPAWPAPCEALDGEALAYVIFTSGSTGEPKGVPVTHRNLSAYLENLGQCYPLHSHDRVAQLAELSFDASVHEWVGAWWVGATLCVVPTRAALMWPRYAAELGVTSLLAVPSSVAMAQAKGLLKPGSLSTLRLVFLGGEALPLSVARGLQQAAPHAQLVNLFGPTEATVAFTHFPIDLSQPLPEVVPIGQPFKDQQVLLCEEQGHAPSPGAAGELMLAGSQVCSAYWNQPAQDLRAFTTIGGQRWYRSGDLVRDDPRWGLCYLGRTDRQVKIKGYRIELQEVELAVSSLQGVTQAAVVAEPAPAGAASGLVCCWTGSQPLDESTLREQLARILPAYMLPGRFKWLQALPLTESGKTDYKALAAAAGSN